MNIDAGNYQIVWRELPKSGLRSATRRNLPQQAPFLVADNIDHVQLSGPLETEALIRGVLHEWLTPTAPRSRDDLAGWRLSQRHLLEDLRSLVGSQSLELLVLMQATRVRETHGHLPAMKMLMTGHHLLRRSSEIRADLILDLWALVESVTQIDRLSVFTIIKQLYEGVRFDVLQEDVTDELDYANFVALSYLGDYQRRNWLFWRVISKRVRHKQLKHRMIRLLNAKPSTTAAMDCVHVRYGLTPIETDHRGRAKDEATEVSRLS